VDPVVQLYTLPTSCGHLASANHQPGGWFPPAALTRSGWTQRGCQRACVVLLGAVYCGSLWVAYWREVRREGVLGCVCVRWVGVWLEGDGGGCGEAAAAVGALNERVPGIPCCPASLVFCRNKRVSPCR
jgi:hypothetical protein